MAGEPVLNYQPGLDGMRALAVIAVILYHAQQSMPSSWMPGGFVGVEVFFVISGYLITALLITEHQRTGRISLGGFWLRRARRLLPALVALLVITMAIVGFAGYRSDSLREHVGPFRGMWLSAWGYATNWYQIAAGLRYGENVGRPPLLRHLWSLAVEEQFYVVWPLIMWAVLARKRRSGEAGRRTLHVTGWVFLALSLAIAAGTAALYRADDLARVNLLYLSTPSRAGGLLLGAALAVFWQPWRAVGRTARGALGIDVLSVVAAAVLVGALVRWHIIDDGELGLRGYDLLFRGGFLIVGAATAVLIVAATHVGSFVGQRVLAWRPLVWVGKRSYGLYLWHWPVFQLMRPRGDLSLLDISRPDVSLAWFPTLLLRLLITVVLTEVSYRWIEMPIRKGGIIPRLRKAMAGAGARRVLVSTAVAALAALIVSSSVVTFGATDKLAVAAACNANPEACGGEDEYASADNGLITEDSVGADAIPADTTDSTAPNGAPDTSVGAAPGTDPGEPSEATTSDSASDPATSAAVGPTPTSSAPGSSTVRRASPWRPIVIGDSVAVGASLLLRRANLRVDAKISRSFVAAIPVLQDLQKRQRLGDVVIIALGTAGGIKEQWIERMMKVLESVPHVVFVTPNMAGRSDGETMHDALLAAADRYPNVTIIDWWSIAPQYWEFNEGNKQVAAADRYFYADKVHLVGKGRRLFADLIIAEAERLWALGD